MHEVYRQQNKLQVELKHHGHVFELAGIKSRSMLPDCAMARLAKVLKHNK